MKADHLEILVEEPSMEIFLAALLPRLIGNRATFTVHSYQGKTDLLAKLGPRLRAYAKWIPTNFKVIVLLDRDNQNCLNLKHTLEDEAKKANLISWSVDKSSWNFASRIAIEELEAWYFGEWTAVVKAYPRINPNIPNQAAYRDPDAIAGGTWEAFERNLQKSNYYGSGLRKLEVAQTIGNLFNDEQCSSKSFLAFRDLIHAAITT